MSDKRKRAIRAIMAETGMNYTAAARENDRRRAAQAEDGLNEVGPGVDPESVPSPRHWPEQGGRK